MSKKKLARIIVVCILAIIIIVVITMHSPIPTSEPMLITHNCTDLAMTSLEAQGEVTDDGGATITRQGFYCGQGLLYGLEFDGIDDRVVLPAGSRPTGAFTLAIWCKPTDWKHADYPTLFGGRGLMSYADGLSGITISRYYDTETGLDRLLFDVADEANAARRTIAPVITDIAPTGEWSLIVLTNSGLAEAEGLKLYRNSALLIGSAIGAQTVRWLDNYLDIGGCEARPKDGFKGIISEVRIYDRALNKTEIKALYKRQDVTGDLRGYWKLDEGSGTTAYDSSGNDNHGSLEGIPEWVLADWDLTGEGKIVYETGKFGTGIYSLNITRLKPDAWYRIRSFAENELGVGYGNVVSCKTFGEA
ncbi:MAG: LamG domain-containing protein [Dehalococcoidia bacterium]